MNKMLKVKNVLATSVLLTSILGGTHAFADGNDTATGSNVSTEQQTATTISASEAGTTPDSFLYTFDKILEDLQLAMTGDSEKESELLLQFAKERLAEAKVMTEAEKQEFVKEAVEEYMKLLAQSQEKVSEAVHEDELTGEKQEDLTDKLEETANVDEKSEEAISEDLDEKTKEALEETQETTKAVANVVKGIDEKVVQSLRDQGFGYGEIAKIVALAEATGKTVEEISAAVKDGKGFGELAKENGLHPKQIATMIKEKRLTAALEEAKTNGDDKKVEQFEKKLAKLEEKKTEFSNKKQDQVKEDKEATETSEKTDAEDAQKETTIETAVDVKEVSKEPVRKVEKQHKGANTHKEQASEEAKKREVKAKEEVEKRGEKTREEAPKHSQQTHKEVQTQHAKQRQPQEKTEFKNKKTNKHESEEHGNHKENKHDK